MSHYKPATGRRATRRQFMDLPQSITVRVRKMGALRHSEGVPIERDLTRPQRQALT